MVNGLSRKWRAGVMLSAILIVGILSFTILGLLENQKMALEFSLRNQQLYEAKVMRELFLKKYLSEAENERPVKGKQIFNRGEITYERLTNGILSIRVKINGTIISLKAEQAEVVNLERRYAEPS